MDGDGLKVPFTREHKVALEQALRAIHDVLPVLDKAEACDSDCSGYRRFAENLREKLTAIERQFKDHFPKGI